MILAVGLVLIASLAPGIPREGEITAGVGASYEVFAEGGRYVECVVRQKGRDVPFTVFVTAPGGSKILSLDSPVSPPGPVVASWLSTETGLYTVEVAAASNDCVEVRLAEIREIREDDPAAILAQRKLLQAEKLRASGARPALLEALVLYQEALPVFQRAQNGIAAAAALSGTARILEVLGDKPGALRNHEQALELQRATGNESAQAYTLNYIAMVQESLGDRQKAFSLVQEALPLARRSGDARVEGITFNNLGMISIVRGEKQQAFEYYTRAQPLHQIAGNLRGEATTLANIGFLYDSTGEKEKAIDYQNRSLELRRRIGDPRDIALVLNNNGATYYSMDRFQEAREAYEEALLNWRAAGDQSGEAATLHNVARVHQAQGDYKSALNDFNRALEIERVTNFRVGEANTLSNIGSLYAMLGDSEKAMEYYNLSLPIQRSAQNRTGEASLLGFLGQACELRGDPEKALEYYNEALPLQQALSNPFGEATILNHIARILASRGKYREALELCERALPLMQAAGSRRGEALTLMNLALNTRSPGDSTKALELVSRAVGIFKDAGDSQGEAAAHFAAAKIYYAAGDLAEAGRHLESTITIVESLRYRIPALPLRSFFLASVRPYYDLHIEVLMQRHRLDPPAGYDIAAFEASERARARALLEALQEAGVPLRRGADPDLLRREQQLRQQLNARAEKQARLLSGAPAAAQVSALDTEIAALSAALQDVETRLRAGDPGISAVEQPQPLSLDAIRKQILDDGTLLLQYSLGEDRSYVWGVSRERIYSSELPGHAVIEAAARRYYEAAMAPQPDAGEAGGELGRMILAPAAGWMTDRRLAIVADGALQYVPFAALPAPSRPLILDHEIVQLPSASAVAALRRESARRGPAPNRLAILADPVFRTDDVRFSGKPPAGAQMVEADLQRAAKDAGLVSFPRLPGTRREASAILELIPENQRWASFDFDASRAHALDPRMAGYRWIHFATHGLLNSIHPELSGLVLSLIDAEGRPQNGFLRLYDIYNLRLNADLVVLSACQTALGRELKGEGMVGLTRGFLHAGASRVVASLWKVDDRATGELMKAFYRGMISGKLQPSAALRNAQIEILQQDRWRAPYYWAAFALQGEWK